MTKLKNSKTKVVPMTQDEHDDLVAEESNRQEEEAFENEIRDLDRDGLIKLIIQDRCEIDRLWSELFHQTAVNRKPSRQAAETKKAQNPSALIFGVKDFPALVLQAVDTSRTSDIQTVRMKLVEIRLKDPSNKIPENMLHRYALRELSPERLKTIKKQRKPSFFD